MEKNIQENAPKEMTVLDIMRQYYYMASESKLSSIEDMKVFREKVKSAGFDIGRVEKFLYDTPQSEIGNTTFAELVNESQFDIEKKVKVSNLLRDAGIGADEKFFI